MQRRLLLNVVVGEGAAVFQLLAGEDQALLVRGNALLVLDLLLDVLDRVGRLDIERDRLAGELKGVNKATRQHSRLISEQQRTVLTKICMPLPPRRRSTKCSVDSFWML